jgi:shikimate kinase
VLAALDALGEDMDLMEATKIGVSAARDVGVTITGALDDALASMLGGVVVTDNREMKLLKREEFDSNVILLVPESRLFSKDTDIKRSQLIAPLADLAFDLAMDGDYCRAMILNGFAYCGALKLSAEPMLIALEAGARGVSLSGTGPSYAALIDEDKIDNLAASWGELGGKVIRTKINNRAASIGRGI